MELQQFGKQLRTLRQQAGWSQEALIEALDQLARSGPADDYRVIDGTLLSRWERAHTQKGRTWKPTRPYTLHLLQLFAPHLDLARAQAWAAQAGYTINAAELQAWFPTAPGAPDGATANAQPTPDQQAASAPAVPHNLPTLLTSFVGREAEIARVLGYLATPATRLITLVGEGGAGKTRLALEVAHRVINQRSDQFRDGIYFVALIGVSAASFVVSALANAVGLALAGVDDPEQQLLTYLQKRRLLLVLDNFEHLLADATPLIAALLPAAPGVQLLVTSRERLNLAEEWVVALSGLAFPSVTAAPNRPGQNSPTMPALSTTAESDYAAVQLFIERAHQTQAEFDPHADAPQSAAIVRICGLLQGIPLGIEMAAAWVHMLSCSEIADEIARNLDFLTSPHRNAPARQRSMRAVFEHSWHLLTQPEQTVLAALAVFQGGFTREAAASVAKATLLTLRSLVDKSLLKVTAGRYELHELLRQFAEEKLQADINRTQAVQECHAQHYGGFLQQLEPLLHGVQEQITVTRIKEEIRNIRSGWHWAITHQRPVILEQYLLSFTPFYSIVNWFQEGKSMFEEARTTFTKILQSSTHPEPSMRRCLAKVMIRESLFDHFLGQPDQAVQLLQESLKILQQYPDDKEICLAYHTLGIIAFNRGDYETSFQYLEQSFAIHSTIDNPQLKASLCVHLGQVEMAVGNYYKAKHWYQTGLKIYQRLEKKWGVANALLNLAKVAELLNEQAEQLYEHSLRLFAELDNRTGIALCNNQLGVIAQKRADYALAHARHQQSLAIYQENGEKTGFIRTLNHLFDVACAQGEEMSAEAYLRTSFELSMEIKAKPLLLQNLLGVVKLLSNKRQPLATQSDRDEKALFSPSLRTIFMLLSLVAKHPASDYQTRHQAQMQLSTLTTQLPDHLIDQLQEQIQATPLGISITSIPPQELGNTSFLRSMVLSLERTFTTDLKLLEQKGEVNNGK